MSTILALDNVSVRFGGLAAVNGVSLELQKGTVSGIIGPNGAGKSTLFNVITGLYRPSAGAIRFNDVNITGARVDAITRLGIARTFQNIRLFAFMSVRETLLVGYHGRLRSQLWDCMLHTPRHRREERAASAVVNELVEFSGLGAQVDRQAHALSYGDQRRLEIARALAAHPALLLLDEPAAGMNPTEKADLLSLIGRIRERGITVLMIEHDMPLVMKACSELMVLDHGETIAQGTPQMVRQNPRVMEAYLGVPAAEPSAIPGQSS